MRISKHPLAKTLLSLAIACAIPVQSMAASNDQEIDALWKTIEDLQQQVAAAEEWKNPNTLVHMAGFGSVGFSKADNEEGSFTTGGFSPIFHYQYRDLLMLESELDFQVTETGETEIGMEYFTIDMFLNDYAILVMGKFLSPLGQFRQNFHPTWINKLPSAPAGFGHDQAAPNADVGFQLRGGFSLGTADANYAVYMGNGVAAEVAADEGEIEMIESPGMNANGSDGNNVGGRFGLYYPSIKLDLGLSWATGKVSEMETETTITIDTNDIADVSSETTFSNSRDWDFIGADITWHHGGLDIRAEYVKQTIGALASSEAPEETELSAYYAQIAYRFLPTKWEAVARTSEYKLGDKTMTRSNVGINYIFASNIVGKLAFENNTNMSVTDRVLVQLAYGF